MSVRYSYDPVSCQRHKTVELIEESMPWHPKGIWEELGMQPAAHEPMLIRIGFEERDLRELVKHAGATWNREKKLWLLAYGEVARLGLTERIVG